MEIMHWLQDKGLSSFYFFAFLAALVVNYLSALWGWHRLGNRFNFWAYFVCLIVSIPGLVVFIVTLPVVLSRFYCGGLRGCSTWENGKAVRHAPNLTRVL